MRSELRVGGRTTSLEEAQAWVSAYFDRDRNIASPRPYAYPAYDELDTGSSTDELNDGDLIAPTLLNAAPSVRAFYGLQDLRDELTAALAATPVDVTLHEAVADGTVDRRLESFVGVLDTRRTWGIRLTTLTKVLHRKRPRLLPLHDRFVHACYVGGTGYPVATARNRTWAAYYTAIARGIAVDLNDQSDAWTHLANLAPDGVTKLRILDVVAWNLGRP